MSVIDEVKQRTDIVDVVSQYATVTKAGRNFRALCPFHSEKRPSFFIYPEQQSWHCFGACNTGGDVLSFIMKKENMDFGEALRHLAQRAGVNIPSRFEPESGKEERERIYRINEAAAQYFHNLLINSSAAEEARDYLADRGISLKTIKGFELGFSQNSWEALKQYLMERGYNESELLEAGLLVSSEDGKTHDRFRNRLIFPIKDIRGRTIGFGGRVFDESLPKYLNSPQTPTFDKSGSLYGLDLAAGAARQQEQVVIVEGYMDVITAHQNGFTNVVAAMGTAVTERQLSTLKRLTKNMALAMDADAAGEEAMLRCVGYENSLDAEVKVIVLPAGKDPDDVIKEGAQTWQGLLEEALPVMDYTIDMVTAKLDLTKARDKTLATDRLLPIIDEMKDVIRQDHYLTKLSTVTGIRYDRLETALTELRLKTKPKKPREERQNRAQPQPIPSTTEEHCLALLLKHPELKGKGAELNERSIDLKPEYFENSQNREIFIAWQQADDLGALRDRIDSTLWEHLDTLVNKDILDDRIELRYNSYILRLWEDYLKNLERKRETVFAHEVESGGSGADLAKLEEEGIEPAIQLREVDTEKARKGQVQRR